MGEAMPRYYFAQCTGIAIMVIVILGSDIDVLYAVPLGILGGVLALFFCELANARIPIPRFIKIRRQQ
jgi:hypothetical protein